MMTNQELQNLVEQVSLDSFGKKFEHLAVFNGRLKSTGGRFHHKDCHLDFNPMMLQEKGLDVFIGIIKHELCHYHLFREKKGYMHQDRDFKILLKEVGGLRYAPPIEKNKKYHYQCNKCGIEYHRIRRINTKKYLCGRCHGRLVQI